MTRNTKTRKKRSRRRIILYGLLAVIVIAVGISMLIPEMPRAAVNMESVAVNVTEIQEATSDVALVQSAKPNVADLTEEDVRSLVREAVALAGGLDEIVQDGDTVVLKPNFIGAAHTSGSFLGAVVDAASGNTEDRILSQTANGIATDYRVAKAVAELVRELNPSGKIYIMEASGSGPIGDTAKNMEILGYTHENIPYVDEFISMDETGSNYAAGDTSDLVAVDIGAYKLYEADEGLAHTNGLYYFDKRYYDADVIISLPVLKNHMMAAVTGGIKNVAIGASPASICE